MDNGEMQESFGGILRQYFLVPRYSLSIPDGTTFTVEVDEEMPKAYISPIPGATEWFNNGQNFVSLRFWQHDGASNPGASAQALDAVMDVLDKQIGIDRLDGGPKTKGLVGSTVHTVIEAVTFVNDENLENPETDESLTRCIDVLLDYHRAYRLAQQSKTPELTYQMIFPIVVQAERDVLSDEPPKLVAIKMLDHTNLPGYRDEVLSHDGHMDLAVYMTRLRHGDPAMLFMERQLDAVVEAHINGRAGEGIVQAAIAAEVLMGGVLAFMLWEESITGKITNDEAAKVLSKDLTTRLKQEYSGRLGGTWALTGQKLYPWHSDVAAVRNRIVHAGYRPEPEQADQALNSLAILREFICDQLAEKFSRYPRTSWIFLGHQGFNRRGRLSRANRWLDEHAVDGYNSLILAWLSDYKLWREAVETLV